ncbi:hypothetical protein ACFL2R_02655 [Patescibacteria group bacterium]
MVEGNGHSCVYSVMDMAICGIIGLIIGWVLGRLTSDKVAELEKEDGNS